MFTMKISMASVVKYPYLVYKISTKLLITYVVRVSSSFHFFLFRFLDNVTKNEKITGKMPIFCTKNKQTGQLTFSFLVTLTKKKKNEKWNELNITDQV